MGIDTIKLSYPTFRRFNAGALGRAGWLPVRGKHGCLGPVWFSRYSHESLGLEVTFKGVGDKPRMLWEGSVPKALGVLGVADAGLVSVLDEALQGSIDASPVLRGLLGVPDVLRVDVTRDFHDPDRKLLAGAIGWMPHERSRYVEEQIRKPDGPLETVWLHNKTRGVRVYDKEAEDGRPWSVGVVRLEYQVRGDWVDRYGLKRVRSISDDRLGEVIDPLAAELVARAK